MYTSKSHNRIHISTISTGSFNNRLLNFRYIFLNRIYPQTFIIQGVTKPLNIKNFFSTYILNQHNRLIKGMPYTKLIHHICISPTQVANDHIRLDYLLYNTNNNIISLTCIICSHRNISGTYNRRL